MKLQKCDLDQVGEADLIDLVLKMQDTIATTTEQRDALLVAVKSAHGYAQRKVLCRCKDTLGRALVDAAKAGFDTPTTPRM